MAIYKITLHNKTEYELYYKLGDKTSIINPDQIKYAYIESNIENLYVYKNKDCLVWSGAIPANTYLELFEDGKIMNIYLENEKVPKCLIGDKSCESRKKPNYIIMIVIFILALLIFYFLYNRGRKYKFKR